MRRFLKILAWTGAVLALLIVAGAAAIYAFLTSDWLRGEAERRVASATDRETRIGRLDIDWGRTTIIDMQDVFIANSDWAKEDAMFAARSVRLSIRLWPLLVGNVVLPELALDAPRIAVETNKDGVGNWSFGESPAAATAAEAATPDERDEMPTIGALRISDGRVVYRDVPRALNLEGTVSTASGKAEGEEKMHLQARGQLEGKLLRVDFTGGSVLQLRDADSPYPLDLAVRFGDTLIEARGTVVDPVAFAAGDLRLHMKGPNLSDIFPVLRVPAPPTPPYELTMRLARKDETWTVTGMQGRVGESDLSGDIAIDYGGKKPVLTADLRSKNLDFDDLAPLVGAPPDTEGEAASAEQAATAQALEARQDAFPDRPLQTELLKVMDMDVRFEAASIHSEVLPVDSLSARVRVEDGRAVAKPLRFTVAQGAIEGEMALNAREQPASADARLSFKDLELKEFFRDSRFVEQTGGKFQGWVSLLGVGNSLAEVMGTARGDAGLAMTGGSLSGLLIEAAGLDIAESLYKLLIHDNAVPIRCAAGKLLVDNGLVSTERLILDTEDSVVYIAGNVNFRSQALDIDVNAQSKNFSPIDLKSDLAVRGKLADPQIGIGRGVPIPFLELGTEQDMDCNALIGGAMVQ
ncbi:MAG: AsmA family protein [Alphaproteobacteria bacterium]